MDAGAVRSLCLGFAEAVEERPFGPETSVFKVGGKIFAIVALDASRPCGSASSASRSWCRPCAGPIPRSTRIPPEQTPWNTVTLDGSLGAELVHDLVEDSYDLVVSGLPKAARERLRSH